MLNVHRGQNVHVLRIVDTRCLSTNLRTPPKSLLQRQAKRLGEAEQAQSSQLIVTSLKDIFSVFHPSGNSQEDDEVESFAKREKVMQRIDSGELRNLYLQKFSARRSGNLNAAEPSLNDLDIPPASLVQVYSRLTQQDRELIEVSLNCIPPNIHWKEIPWVQKQLLFYTGYGSYGPRENISFLGSKPEDFIWRHPAKVLKSEQKVHQLKKEQLQNVWTCIPQRKSRFDSMRTGLDPGTRMVAFIGIVVALLATFEDFQLYQDKESKSNVACFAEEGVTELSDNDFSVESLASDQPKGLDGSPSRKWFQWWKR
ncbi:LADA_0A03928g1_1 [Lachancea dasiensis]|uniref:LADA_0A03928g1_1 n=1 Tax=Lachancea dasiensis TaxID=1072105 RepID=A0A1G4IN74_9SACH|nr:LADA_0A03928g1_1 [Lachancea dasiensis]